MTYFTYLHPMTKALYHGLLFLCIMIVFNPLTMILALIGLLMMAKTMGEQSIKGYGGFFGFFAATIVLINFVFNHRGAHVLFYFLDRPMTLEALLYGITSAMMIICTILLFQNVTRCISTSEFLYLFSGTAPGLGILVSMTCGFFQLFTERGKEIQQAVKMKNIDMGSGTLKERSMAGMQIMHVLIALTLENALVTVLSMKTRAYDLRKRTNGLIFRLRLRDGLFIGLTVILSGSLILAWITGYYSMTVYPSIDMTFEGGNAAVFYIVYGLLLLMPFYRAGSYKKKLQMQLQKEGIR